MTFILIWLAVGLISTFFGIRLFRHDLKDIPTRELYQAAIGPFLGPVILILLLIDIFGMRK